MLTKSNNHGGNLAYGTLGHVMTAHVMGLNNQCQWPSNILLSKTNVQYKNILFKFNYGGIDVVWRGDKA